MQRQSEHVRLYPHLRALIDRAPPRQKLAMSFMERCLAEGKRESLDKIIGGITPSTRPSVIPRSGSKSPGAEKRELVCLSRLIEGTSDPVFHASMRFMAREIGVEGLRPLEAQLSALESGVPHIHEMPETPNQAQNEISGIRAAVK